ncbi:MAG: hypothetical protein JW969_03875 [Spirochaetales bacterium]|nr:hypothetical protein [Spirochaetales bacterium]
MAEHISIFVENKIGKLESITRVLSSKNINLRGLSVASSRDFGIIKILPDDVEKAYNVLAEEKFTVQKRKILVVEITDRVGSLHDCLMVLKDSGINVEDCYGTVINKTSRAVIILEVEDIPSAQEALKDGKGIRILSEKEIAGL